jgi:hypothetical protein
MNMEEINNNGCIIYAIHPILLSHILRYLIVRTYYMNGKEENLYKIVVRTHKM